MKLSDRLRARRSAASGIAGAASSALDQETFNAVKSMVHFRLVEELDLSTAAAMSKQDLGLTIRQALQQITAAEKMPLNQRERSELVADLINEILGFGPIEPLVQDESVQDILVNGCRRVYVERGGRLEPTAVEFRDDDHLMQVIDKIVSAVGRRIDEASPMVDARLPDGSRVNVIVPPLALDGPSLSIRKFGHGTLTLDHLLGSAAMTEEMADYLRAAVRSRLNLLISGGTGAGKTTLLNILAGFIPGSERVVTIEDSAELRLMQPHVVRLESRPPNIEGRGEVTLTDLVKNSLRMRPDRIIVGEARGAEVVDMLQAMNTGHPGSMSTIHTNSPRDALSRLEILLGMGGNQFSERSVARTHRQCHSRDRSTGAPARRPAAHRFGHRGRQPGKRRDPPGRNFSVRPDRHRRKTERSSEAFPPQEPLRALPTIWPPTARRWRRKTFTFAGRRAEP